MLGEILQALRQSVPASLELLEKEQFIINCIQQNASISAKAIAERAGVSPRLIEMHLTKMKKRGILQRDGARKNGKWRLLLPVV